MLDPLAQASSSRNPTAVCSISTAGRTGATSSSPTVTISTRNRSAGFTTVAIVTLGLGIGATTTIFSVVNAVLLRPLPYPDADRIVQVFQIIERPNVGTPLRGGLTPDQFQIWRDEADAVSQIAVHGVRTFTLTGVAEAVRLNGAAVTPSLFPLRGVAPLIGRTFEPEAAQPGSAPVVILSQATWERYLGSDPAVLDRMLTLEGTPYRVVGVMPRGFDFPALPAAYRDATGALDDLPQFWVPVGLRPPNPNPTTDIDLMPTLAERAPRISRRGRVPPGLLDTETGHWP